jgi:hypothetical protein
MAVMKLSSLFVTSLAVLSLGATARAEKPIAIANGGFEEQLAGWEGSRDNGMSVATADAARNGKLGLRVTDKSDTLGSSLGTKPIPVTPGKTYEARFSARLVSGQGIAVYVRFFNAKGEVLNTLEKKNQNSVGITRAAKEWSNFSVKGVAPADAATVDVWIHSFLKNVVTADFDEISFYEL